MSAITFVATLLIVDKSLSKIKKILWIVYGFFMSFTMAFSVHWLSDVLSGYCYGLIIALAVHRTKINI